MYEIYMEEYMNEYIKESTEVKKTKDKEDVYKINYYLRDNLQIPYVSNVLAKPRVQEQLIEFVGKFLDDHSKELSTSGPVHIIIFSERETAVLYDMFSINADTLLELYNKMVEETFYGKISKFFTGWVKNAPHKLLITASMQTRELTWA